MLLKQTPVYRSPNMLHGGEIERKHAMLLSPVQGSTFYFGQIMGSGLTKLKMSARSPQKTSLYKHWWRPTENHLTCWQINNCTPVCLYPWHQWCSPVPMNETFLKKESKHIVIACRSTDKRDNQNYTRRENKTKTSINKNVSIVRKNIEPIREKNYEPDWLCLTTRNCLTKIAFR